MNGPEILIGCVRQAVPCLKFTSYRANPLIYKDSPFKMCFCILNGGFAAYGCERRSSSTHRSMSICRQHLFAQEVPVAARQLGQTLGKPPPTCRPRQWQRALKACVKLQLSLHVKVITRKISRYKFCLGFGARGSKERKERASDDFARLGLPPLRRFRRQDRKRCQLCLSNSSIRLRNDAEGRRQRRRLDGAA
jgi:hypothetical protein